MSAILRQRIVHHQLRRVWQRAYTGGASGNTTNVEYLQRQLADSQRALTRNMYDIVLIDGDGMKFLPEFINDGIVGGTRVAHRVYGAARNIISSEDDDSTELIIRVYANVTGLENALRINGCYSESRSLRDFTNGFTQAENQTSFIDVGAGKEAVDEKLRSELHWHLKNYNCRHILFGASHDMGYVPCLKSLSAKRSSIQRISLIEGVAFGKMYSSLPFKKVRFPPSIFTPLPLEQWAQTKIAPPPQSVDANSNTHPFDGLLSVSSTTCAVRNPTVKPSLRDFAWALQTLVPTPCMEYYMNGACSFKNCKKSHSHEFNERGQEMWKQIAVLSREDWNTRIKARTSKSSKDPVRIRFTSENPKSKSAAEATESTAAKDDDDSSPTKGDPFMEREKDADSSTGSAKATRAQEVVDKPTEKPAKEPAKEPVDSIAEGFKEAQIEDSKEKPAEDSVDKPKDESTKKPEEESVEESAEPVTEQKNQIEVAKDAEKLLAQSKEGPWEKKEKLALVRALLSSKAKKRYVNRRWTSEAIKKAATLVNSMRQKKNHRPTDETEWMEALVHREWQVVKLMKEDKGFSWPRGSRWANATEEDWRRFIAKYPEAERYRSEPVPDYYSSLDQIYVGEKLSETHPPRIDEKAPQDDKDKEQEQKQEQEQGKEQDAAKQAEQAEAAPSKDVAENKGQTQTESATALERYTGASLALTVAPQDENRTVNQPRRPLALWREPRRSVSQGQEGNKPQEKSLIKRVYSSSEPPRMPSLESHAAPPEPQVPLIEPQAPLVGPQQSPSDPSQSPKPSPRKEPGFITGIIRRIFGSERSD